MSTLLKIARGVLAGANKNRQDAEELEREQRADAEERRRREFDEGLRSTTTLARLAEQGFIFGDDAEDDSDPDDPARFFDPDEAGARGGPPPRPTGSGRDDRELEELPALPVIQDQAGKPIYGPTPDERPRRPMEIASEIVRSGSPARRRPVSVGTIVVDGKRVAVSYDPENTPAGKTARRNRAAYEQLQRAGQIGPDAEFDELEDYAAMLREQQTERRRSERRAGVLDTVTAALVAKKVPEAQARRIAEIYVKPDGSVAAGIGDYLDEEDLATFREKEEIRASTAARYRAPRKEPGQTPAQKRAIRLRSAQGNAGAWAEGGRSAEAIANALARFYPDLSHGELRGIAIEAVRSKKRANKAGAANDDVSAFFDEDDDGGDEDAGAGDKGEAPDSVVDAALRKFGGDEAKAAAHLRSQGYR